jgi:hypothetical protein
MAKNTRFSPIYDSGCSFGRELIDGKVTELVNNQEMIEAYVQRGLSEIHWKKEKISHFTLLKHLLENEEISKYVKNVILRIEKRFDSQKVNELIQKVDANLPEKCNAIRIPDERKQLMTKLVVTRFDNLKTLIGK